MIRKILITALLCLTLQQTAQAQTYYGSMTEAITEWSRTSNRYYCDLLTIYHTVNCPLNGSGLTNNHYIVWAVAVTRPVSGTVNLYVNEYNFVVEQNQAGNYAVKGSVDGATFPYLNDAGNITNTWARNPSVSRGDYNRILYTMSDVTIWYTGYNEALSRLPQSIGDYNELMGTSYTCFYTHQASPRNPSDLTADTDGGGMSDWDEIFRMPVASNVNNGNDDPLCWCNPCCTCECICGGYKTALCGGLGSDCDCHKPWCYCNACCSCECICGGRHATICDGTLSGCSCHVVCTCNACCSCECICGYWRGSVCSGNTGPSGCSCHAECSCGACCSCQCSCGNWKGATCGGESTDCRCHRNCREGCCCSCRCTCGDWTGSICNGGSDCDCHSCTCAACCSCRCICGNWPSAILGDCEGGPNDCDCHIQCDCGACCQCRCTCGNWRGASCDGTGEQCSCHTCQCGACCSCQCTCGQWWGEACSGRAADCECHESDTKTCTCGACCSCNCVCGNWHLHVCGKTPEYCSCHEPIESADWFPSDELKEAFTLLKEKLQEKLGINLQEIFENIQGSQFTEIRIDVPQILPGAPTSTIYFNIEDISQYSVVGVIRTLFLAAIFITMVQVILVILRQY